MIVYHFILNIKETIEVYLKVNSQFIIGNHYLFYGTITPKIHSAVMRILYFLYLYMDIYYQVTAFNM